MLKERSAWYWKLPCSRNLHIYNLSHFASITTTSFLLPLTPFMELVARGAAFIILPVAWIFRIQGQIVFASV